MQQTFKKDTLSYQFTKRPAIMMRDMSAVRLKDVVARMNAYFDLSNIFSMSPGLVGTPENPMGSPEVDGLMFYMSNHAMSMVRAKYHPLETLPTGVLSLVDNYFTDLSARSARMFFYLLLICTRESRHDKSSGNNLKHTYGPGIKDFHNLLKGTVSATAVESLRTKAPDTSLGEYTSFLADIFRKGTYGFGFGGVAWAKVAEVLRDFVLGKISAEMMQDTAFTLCHNNGPIFNKGMLFQKHTTEIYKLLDVQRSGQIPELVASKVVKAACSHVVQESFTMYSNTLGPEFAGEGYVDWFKVESLGSLKKYPTEKIAQVSKYGTPANVKEASVKAEAAFVYASSGVMPEIPNSIDGGVFVSIFPGFKIKKTVRPI